MARSTYRLYVAGDRTEHTTTGTRPAAALRELCAATGRVLVEQHGRYGRVADQHAARGTAVAALTEPWSCKRSADHGTTRLP